jgi:hypothetical protein
MSIFSMTMEFEVLFRSKINYLIFLSGFDGITIDFGVLIAVDFEEVSPEATKDLLPLKELFLRWFFELDSGIFISDYLLYLVLDFSFFEDFNSDFFFYFLIILDLNFLRVYICHSLNIFFKSPSFLWISKFFTSLSPLSLTTVLFFLEDFLVSAFL